MEGQGILFDEGILKEQICGEDQNLAWRWIIRDKAIAYLVSSAMIKNASNLYTFIKEKLSIYMYILTILANILYNFRVHINLELWKGK